MNNKTENPKGNESVRFKTEEQAELRSIVEGFFSKSMLARSPGKVSMLVREISGYVAKQKEEWEKEYQRREDESNLEMLTWLMDERSERMYMGDGNMKDNYWLCNTALTAVDTGRIETERRKLIAHLPSKEQETPNE